MSDGSALNQPTVNVRLIEVEQEGSRSSLSLYVPTPDQRGKLLSINFAIKAFCVAIGFWMVASLFIQSNVGLGNNGDFFRINSLFTSGPAEIESLRPDPRPEQTPECVQFWTRYWKFDCPHLNIKYLKSHASNTSTALLWLPGLLWNHMFYSPDVFHAVALSLFPRILLVLMLWLIFRWIRDDATTIPGEKPALIVAVGLPFVLLATATDYVAYLNSFYFETGSLIYLFIFFGVFIYSMRRSERLGRTTIIWPALALLLLSTAKISNIYWPLLAAPFVMVYCGVGHRWRYRLCVGAALAITLTVATVMLIRLNPQSSCQNSFNRLFNGALVFSDDPSARLAELGMPDGDSFIGKSVFAFSEEELDAVMERKKPLPLSSFLYVLYREPVVVFRMMKHAADNMQAISVHYLETRALEDPPIKPGKAANLWADLKATCFPTGYALYGVLALYCVLFFAAARNTRRLYGLRRELALVGLMATIACFVDMNVTVFGDGRTEQVKHLFLANVLFDVATIAAVSTTFLLVSARLRGKTKAASAPIIAFEAERSWS